MPDGAGGVVTSLGAQLLFTLLRCLLLVAAFVAALATLRWLIGRVRPTTVRRIQARWMSATSAEPAARRFLRLGLALLWIVDGLLQAQPRMPAGFVPEVLAPGMADGPRWLAAIARPIADAWLRHPVTADAATVFVQVGLGLLIAFTPWSSLAARTALWGSILWALTVWVLGEFFGGLLSRGASWLTGAPGAVLVYLLAAGVLLADMHEQGSTDVHRRRPTDRLARRLAGSWLICAAVLQLMPWERNWSGEQLAATFATPMDTVRFHALARPILDTANLGIGHPIAFNATLGILLLVIGLGLWTNRSRPFVLCGVLLCLLTWWLAQGFGVLGGLGTDPNTAFALAILLVAGWPRRLEPTSAAPQPPATVSGVALAAMPYRDGVRAVATLCGAGAALFAPAILAMSLLTAPDSNAVLADSAGGVISLAGRQAPGFALLDQNNRLTTLTNGHKDLVLLAFFDPVCSDDCPIIANQLSAAVSEMGSLAGRIDVIAIDSNPVFHNHADVAAFTAAHGLTSLANWHFLAGSESQLSAVLDSYGVTVQVPAVGMISHSDDIYFISGSGQELAYLSDGANADLQAGYVHLVQDEVRKLLH
jgi:cytochrome oxidase Cu insertion factor (SCO1/SenC/PrrC family)